MKLKDLGAPYQILWKFVSEAYHDYGGWAEFLRSPYFQLSVIFSLFLVISPAKLNWPELIISVCPSLLGFTLAGYTVFISSLSERLQRALVAAKTGSVSYYKKINVAFFHFIFFQTFALFFAFLGISFSSFSVPSTISELLGRGELTASKLNQIGSILINFCGTSVLMYSIMLVIAVLIWIYRIISISESALAKQIAAETKNSSKATPRLP